MFVFLLARRCAGPSEVMEALIHQNLDLHHVAMGRDTLNIAMSCYCTRERGDSSWRRDDISPCERNDKLGHDVAGMSNREEERLGCLPCVKKLVRTGCTLDNGLG